MTRPAPLLGLDGRGFQGAKRGPQQPAIGWERAVEPRVVQQGAHRGQKVDGPGPGGARLGRAAKELLHRQPAVLDVGLQHLRRPGDLAILQVTPDRRPVPLGEAVALGAQGHPQPPQALRRVQAATFLDVQVHGPGGAVALDANRAAHLVQRPVCIKVTLQVAGQAAGPAGPGVGSGLAVGHGRDLRRRSVAQAGVESARRPSGAAALVHTSARPCRKRARPRAKCSRLAAAFIHWGSRLVTKRLFQPKAGSRWRSTWGASRLGRGRAVGLSPPRTRWRPGRIR